MKIRLISKERRFNSPFRFQYMSLDSSLLDCSKIIIVKPFEDEFIDSTDQCYEGQEIEEIIDTTPVVFNNNEDDEDDEDW